MIRQSVLLFVVVTAAASSAQARPNFPSEVPATPGENVCGTCHDNPAGGGPRNDFGQDVEATLADGAPDWSAVFCMDSDGDGKTNGQELGDACGVWAPGDTPSRTDDVTIPADPASTTAAEEQCEGAEPPTCDRAAAVGCAQGGASTSLALVLFLAFVKRRARR